MIEKVVISYIIEDGRYISKAETKLVRKNQGSKPTYRGIKIHNKTPLSMRGLRVIAHRNEVKSIVDLGSWTVRDADTKNIIIYCNELYLQDVSPNFRENKPGLVGVVIPPTEEYKSLRAIVGVVEGNKMIISNACDRCKEVAIEHFDVAHLTPNGVFVQAA